jgi:hypothetical protein
LNEAFHKPLSNLEESFKRHSIALPRSLSEAFKSPSTMPLRGIQRTFKKPLRGLLKAFQVFKILLKASQDL